MQTNVEIVTPTIASEWLKLNRNIRPISDATVSSYAHAMRSGQWALTHQSIAFDPDGYVIDGQHRLKAVVISGVTIKMSVSRAVPATAHSPIDQGQVRSPWQVLGVSQRVVGMTHVLHKLSFGQALFSKVKTSLALFKEMEEQHPDYPKVVELFRSKFGSRGIRPAVMAALVYAYPVDPKKVEQFAIDVRDGELLRKGDPAYALRVWLLSERSKRTPMEVALATLNAVAYAIADAPLASVHTGIRGYRAVSTRRRAMNIPYTPPAGVIETQSMPKEIGEAS